MWLHQQLGGLSTSWLAERASPAMDVETLNLEGLPSPGPDGELSFPAGEEGPQREESLPLAPTDWLAELGFLEDLPLIEDSLSSGPSMELGCELLCSSGQAMRGSDVRSSQEMSDDVESEAVQARGPPAAGTSGWSEGADFAQGRGGGVFGRPSSADATSVGPKRAYGSHGEVSPLHCAGGDYGVGKDGEELQFVAGRGVPRLEGGASTKGWEVSGGGTSQDVGTTSPFSSLPRNSGGAAEGPIARPRGESVRRYNSGNASEAGAGGQKRPFAVRLASGNVSESAAASGSGSGSGNYSREAEAEAQDREDNNCQPRSALSGRSLSAGLPFFQRDDSLAKRLAQVVGESYEPPSKAPRGANCPEDPLTPLLPARQIALPAPPPTSQTLSSPLSEIATDRKPPSDPWPAAWPPPKEEQVSSLPVASTSEPQPRVAEDTSGHSSADVTDPGGTLEADGGCGWDAISLGMSTKLAVNSEAMAVAKGADLGVGTEGGAWAAVETPLGKQLIAFAEAIATDDDNRARFLMKRLREDANMNGDPMQRCAFYFMEGLWARSSGNGVQRYLAYSSTPNTHMEQMLSEINRLLPFMDFVGTSAIANFLDACEGETQIHVLDMGVWHGNQWPKFMRLLAARSTPPPSLRITKLQLPPASSNYVYKIPPIDYVEYKRTLVRVASTLGIPFEYQALQVNLENLTAAAVHLRPGETLLVNGAMRFHTLQDSSTIRSSPRDAALRMLRGLEPKMVVLGEKQVDHNGPFFLRRFSDALDYYGALFDSLDCHMPRTSAQRHLFEKNLLGRDIVNVVACEGMQRVARSERLDKWRSRMKDAGFVGLTMKPSIRTQLWGMLERFSSGWSIQEEMGALFLCWKGKRLVAASAWRVAC